MATPPSGNFPETQAVWINNQLDAGSAGESEVRRRLMAIYQRPLEVYCRATGLGRANNLEPDDLVNGFFASRLADQAYLRSWSLSGLRLRQWLRNGMNFYVRELIRKQSRKDRLEPSGFAEGEAGGSTGATGVAHPTESPSAESAFERDWARGALNAAIDSLRLESLNTGMCSGRYESVALPTKHWRSSGAKDSRRCGR